MVPSIPVHLVDYDPAWPEIAATHMAALRAMPNLFVSAHHIGSTSIAGMIAKPVVDLIGITADIDELDRRQSEMEALGYRAFGEFGVPGRRFFTLDDPTTGARIINLHCYQTGSESARSQIAFRNYLRDHPATAQAYAAEKRRAGKLFPDNSTQYAAEKGPFIAATLAKALSYAAAEQARASTSVG